MADDDTRVIAEMLGGVAYNGEVYCTSNKMSSCRFCALYTIPCGGFVAAARKIYSEPCSGVVWVKQSLK